MIKVSEQNISFWLRLWSLVSSIYIRNVNAHYSVTACVLRLSSPAKQSLKGAFCQMLYWEGSFRKEGVTEVLMCGIQTMPVLFSLQKLYIEHRFWKRGKENRLFSITLGLYDNEKLLMCTISVPLLLQFSATV